MSIGPDDLSGANPADYSTAPAADTNYDSRNHVAPHNITTDGSANAAFTAGTKPHVQYPVAELDVRNVATSSGGAEGLATYDPQE